MEYATFLEARYPQSNSRRRKIQTLRIFFDYLIEKNYFTDNPVRKLVNAALEAITDALRVELRGWGIHVAIVEPDSVATPIWDKFQTDSDALAEKVPPAVRDLYEEDLLQMRKAARRMDRTGMPVEKVVRAIRHALCARRPSTRYPLGWRSRLGPWLFSGIPDRLRDWIVLRMMGVRK